MKRRLDKKALTTTIAAVLACGVMGSAVTKIMLKRVGSRYSQPPSLETLKSAPQAPKPSRVARSLTA
ncbi:MAG: hypothetical protein AAB250_09640 [Bdellovibrionota bacterium]